MDPLLLAMLGAGAASGLHCVGMCGGIVTAFAGRPVIPIRPAEVPAPDPRLRLLAFNAGRITSYAFAGALAGLAGGAAYAASAVPLQSALYVAASLMLLIMGLHLAGAGRLLAGFEALGQPLWRRVQPWAARLLPSRTLPGAYGAGLAWGFLPCAMVYAALLTAASTGSPLRGAAAMAAFGAGTLPFLLAAGWLAARFRRLMAARRAGRLVPAAVLLAFGAYGLAHAGALGDTIRRGLLCL